MIQILQILKIALWLCVMIKYIRWSYFTIDESSTVLFTDNIAAYGGSILTEVQSVITIKGYSTTQFINNHARYGGAINFQSTSVMDIEENSIVTFVFNTAELQGGAISSKLLTHPVSYLLKIQQRMYFNKNRATFGESIFSSNYSTVAIYKNSLVKFNNNTAKWYGGELYSNQNYVDSS